MLFFRLEVSALNDNPKLWDTIFFSTPVVYMTFLTLAGKLFLDNNLLK